MRERLACEAESIPSEDVSRLSRLNSVRSTCEVEAFPTLLVSEVELFDSLVSLARLDSREAKDEALELELERTSVVVILRE